MKNGYLRTDDGPPRIVGDSIVAYDRRDWAIVVKSSMGRGANSATSHHASMFNGIRFGYRPHFDVSTPLAAKHRPVDWKLMLSKPREYLAFFKGSPSSGARQALEVLHDPANGFIALLQGTTPQSEYDSFDYETTLRNSRFGLAPAGVGYHSYRMSEVMQAGTVCVDVQRELNSFVLPYSDTLDWSKFSFSFATEDKTTFSQMGKILKAVSETQWRKMQLRSMLVYQHFFTSTREATVIFEILKRRIENAVKESDVHC